MSTTELATIEHLILLDLLGSKDPTIQPYFLDTAWLFDSLISAEKRLFGSGALGEEAQVKGTRSFFAPRKDMLNHAFIEDDHLPFIQKGVSVLHLIASPFPRVWHTLLVGPLIVLLYSSSFS